MSLKRKLAADDDEGDLSPAVAAASASSPSPSSSSSAVPQPASVAAKRPRRHQPAPAPAPVAVAARPQQQQQQHGSLQRAGDARPRASSAPCSSRHHRSASRSQPARAIAPLPRAPASAAEKVIYPSWAPDVTRHSLRSIDLDVLQYNTQFRHDFMLDGPHKFTRVLGKPKREDSTRYWLAVLMELETGCTCVAFDDANKVWPCVCPDARPASAHAAQHAHHQQQQVPGKMPSRVLPMLVELRTLLRHVTSPAAAAAAPDSPFRPPQPEPPHAHGDALAVLLDEHRVFDEVRRGVYDHVPLFRYIGQLLKEHCAPMRDARIDNMVAFACDGPPADPARPPTTASWKSHVLQAIRMCFEILELMAMDIANHQLLTHRARLMATTASLELSAFRNKFLLHDPPTLHVACIQSSLQQRLDSRTLGTGTWEDQLRSSLVRTVVDLIFDPAVLGGPRSPGLRIPPNFPETFYLDHSRMCRFSSEACDLSVLYMLLLLARSPPFSVSDATVAAALKSEIASIAPPRLGLCFGSALRSRHHSKDSAASEWDQWRQGISDVLLQIARRASKGGVPSQSMLETLERWADTNLQERSALSGVCQKRLREALYEAVALSLQSPPARSSGAAQRLPVPVLAPMPQQPCAQAVLHISTRPPAPFPPAAPSRFPAPAPPAQPSASAASNGLDAFAVEIDSLGRRIAEVVAHHWTVYRELYMSPGFLH